MSNSNPVDDVESLRSAFHEVLKVAHANDVEIEGSLTVRTSSEHTPDWEVQIWEIE